MMAYRLFQIGQQRYAINSQSVYEIIKWRQPTSLPYSNIAVMGMIAWQGELVPVIDLLRFWSVIKDEQQTQYRQILIMQWKKKGEQVVPLLGIGISRALMVNTLEEKTIQFISSNEPMRTAIKGNMMTSQGVITVLSSEIIGQIVQ